MAKRHLTAKQIRAGFGGKRRKTSLRSKPKRRHAARRKMNSAPKRRRKVSSHRPRTKKRATAKRRNPVAEILSWTAGNPARKRGKKKMAHSKKKRRSSARRNTAGRSHSKKSYRRKIHRNPGFLGSPMDWVKGGAGVLGGVVVTRALPQLVLGASNTGPMGYAANVVAALAAGWLTHMIFPRDRVLTGAVVAGGFAATVARVIADKTPFGAQLSLTGLGDWSGLGLYQKSNFSRPQHLVNGRPGTPGSSNFAFGPGAPYGNGLPSLSNAGSDSTSNC